MSTRQSLFFTAPRCVEIRSEALPVLKAGQALVRSRLSAISPGTECLIFSGRFPTEMAADTGIGALTGKLSYPLKYGYSTVGEVVELGTGVDPGWLGKTVFAFNPHETFFAAPVESLQPIPSGLPAETAVFLPNMETAVNFLMDGKPLIGERVVVLGQGIVGLLTTALLASFPLAALITFDRYELRRAASARIGATLCLDPQAVGSGPGPAGELRAAADLCYELSGSPAALDLAIALTGFDGRIVIGSWYGQNKAALDLGGAFHRSRIRLLSSQVSTLASDLTGRWDKARRFELAWTMLERIRPAQFITHRFNFEDAGEAYRLLEEHPEGTIQVLLTYPE